MEIYLGRCENKLLAFSAQNTFEFDLKMWQFMWNFVSNLPTFLANGLDLFQWSMKT